MRTVWAILVLAVMLVGLSVLGGWQAVMAPTATVDAAAACVASAAYVEATTEHELVMLRILAFSAGQGMAIPTVEGLAVFHSQLISMRHYHEGAAAWLPACAQAYNSALIGVITAGQDVLALVGMAQLLPDSARAEMRVAQSVDVLRERWLAWQAAKAAVTVGVE